MIELELLVGLLSRNECDKHFKSIKQRSLSKQTRSIANCIYNYFVLHKSGDLDTPALKKFFYENTPTLEESDKKLYNEIFALLSTYAPEFPLIDTVKKLSYKSLVSSITSRNDIVTMNDLEAIKDQLDTFSANKEDEFVPISTDIGAALKEANFKDGYRWAIEALNKNLTPIPHKGVFNVIAGRPNASKSSFLIYNMVHISKQLPPGKKILWLNNENTASRVYMRVVSCALQRTLETIQNHPIEQVSKKYLKVMGNEHRFIFGDIHGRGISAVKSIIAKYKDEVELVVIDMLDKILPSKDDKSFSSNTDAWFGHLYDTMLDLSCTTASIIGTSQLRRLDTEDPDKHRYPSMDDLTQSGTGKAGSASNIITLGQDDNESIRYIASPKNKFGTGGDGWSAMVEFSPTICAYREI